MEQCLGNITINGTSYENYVPRNLSSIQVPALVLPNDTITFAMSTAALRLPDSYTAALPVAMAAAYLFVSNIRNTIENK